MHMVPSESECSEGSGFEECSSRKLTSTAGACTHELYKLACLAPAKIGERYLDNTVHVVTVDFHVIEGV